MMLRMFKVTYIKAETTRTLPKRHTVEIEAYSKYDTKKRFRRMYPGFDIIKIEEVQE